MKSFEGCLPTCNLMPERSGACDLYREVAYIETGDSHLHAYRALLEGDCHLSEICSLEERMTTDLKRQTPWYLWPFVAIWKLLAVIVEMTGRLVAMIVGIVLMIVGLLVSLTIVGAIIGIPLAIIGLLLFLRGIF